MLLSKSETISYVKKKTLRKSYPIKTKKKELQLRQHFISYLSWAVFQTLSNYEGNACLIVNQNQKAFHTLSNSKTVLTNSYPIKFREHFPPKPSLAINVTVEIYYIETKTREK